MQSAAPCARWRSTRILLRKSAPHAGQICDMQHARARSVRTPRPCARMRCCVAPPGVANHRSQCPHMKQSGSSCSPCSTVQRVIPVPLSARFWRQGRQGFGGRAGNGHNPNHNHNHNHHHHHHHDHDHPTMNMCVCCWLCLQLRSPGCMEKPERHTSGPSTAGAYSSGESLKATTKKKTRANHKRGCPLAVVKHIYF